MKRKNCKKSFSLIFTIAFVFLSFAFVNAQGQAGGSSGAYGQVYGAGGKATATKDLRDSMNNTMRQTTRRIAARKAARKKAAAKPVAKTVRGSSKPAKKTPAEPAENIPVVRNYAAFTPDPSVNTGQVLADTLGTTPDEKALIKQIFSLSKTGFETEAPKGFKNNYAGALTFFIVTTTTVYHDAAEPSDEAVSDLFDSINETIDQTPEFGQIPNREKQEFYNTMIGFSGIVLAGYLEGKQNGDQETVETYRKIAGILLQLVLKTDPDKISFTKDGFEIN